MQTIIAITLAAVSFSAGAEDMTPDEMCGTYHDMAEAVMVSRQNEVPMVKVMAFFSDAPEGARDIFNNIIMAAYEEPGYSTPEYQQKAAAEFANQVTLECYRGLGY